MLGPPHQGTLESSDKVVHGSADVGESEQKKRRNTVQSKAENRSETEN